MSNLLIPPLVRWEQNARNGMSPSGNFYAQCMQSQNFSMISRTREVFSRSWPLTSATTTSGTTNLARFRFRSRYGATRLRAYVVLSPTDRYDAVSPRCEIDVTESGGGTETIGPFYYALAQTAPTDAPDEWCATNAYCTISPATVYECNVKVIDWCRLLAITVVEEIDATVDPTVNYFNAYEASATSPLFDVMRERLLAGSVAMWKQGAGTITHWARPDGTAQTRTSATLANLIDGSTTGSPATSAPGFYLDCNYRNTVARTTVSFEAAVYASTSSGSSGVVHLTDSGGTNRISITGIGTTPGWYTATGSLSTAETWYAPRFACDGINTLSCYAFSLIEFEA